MTSATARRRGGRRPSSSAGPTAREPDAPLLLDTSAAIALILEDHEAHAAATAAVRGRQLGLAGHAWFETYSVLTRLPSGQRRSPEQVARILAHDFPASVFLDPGAAAALAGRLATLGVAGGSVFDALVGAAVQAHGSTLVSTDRRASPTYDALGIDVRWIEPSST